ncbi:MAG: STAS domain-containing protein [Clostridia bacterium]|nr:STAS domain-containing protein [Clostridia bacterium]
MVRCEASNEVVTAYLCGEIDHHIAPKIREDIDANIQSYRPKLLILDFSDVSFMDSSGIGLIMGRYRKMSLSKGKTEVVCPCARMQKIMQMAGIDRLVEIRKEQTDEVNK